MAVENHGGCLLSSLDSFKAFVELNHSPRLGVALAPYHLQAAGISVEDVIAAAGKQLFFFYAWQHADGLGQLPGIGPTELHAVDRRLGEGELPLVRQPLHARSSRARCHVQSVGHLAEIHGKLLSSSNVDLISSVNKEKSHGNASTPTGNRCHHQPPRFSACRRRNHAGRRRPSRSCGRRQHDQTGPGRLRRSRHRRHGKRAFHQGPTKLWAMADVFADRLQPSLQGPLETVHKQVEVPKERQFLGTDGYKKAIDAIGPGGIVLLTTPPAFRPIHLEYAVAKGCHVFMEKSFAVDAAGVRRVLKAGAEAHEKESENRRRTDEPPLSAAGRGRSPHP